MNTNKDTQINVNEAYLYDRSQAYLTLDRSNKAATFPQRKLWSYEDGKRKKRQKRKEMTKQKKKNRNFVWVITSNSRARQQYFASKEAEEEATDRGKRKTRHVLTNGDYGLVIGRKGEGRRKRMKINEDEKQRISVRS